MSIQTLELQPPPGFDPNNSQHVARIFEKVVEAERKKAGASEVTDEMGDNRSDWKVLSFDSKTNKLTIYRQSAITQIDEDRRGVRVVAIPAGTKATEAEGIAARLQEMNPGYYLSEFNPHLGKAQLTKMTLDEVRVREAIATAIGVKPWDLKVKGSRSSGYQVKLPTTYMQSKHDEKIQEVAETIAGQFGWYWESDPVSLKGNIVPSVPPTFPASITYPMELLPQATPGLVNPIPFGMALADRGDEENEVIWLRLEDAPHLQLGGTSGSGKRLSLDTRIPTPTGWTTMGDLKVGDEVLSRAGESTRVIAVSETEQTPDLYRITLSDGQTIDADYDHQWVVVRARAHNDGSAAASDALAMQAAADTLRIFAHGRPGLSRVTTDELLRLLAPVPTFPWRTEATLEAALRFMDVTVVRGTRDTHTAFIALADRLDWLAKETAKLREGEAIFTTGELLADGGDFAIRAASPLLGEDVDLPVAPYTLGHWLAAGSPSSPPLSDADLAQIQVRLERDGEQSRANAPTGIPSDYQRASFYQRIALVQGVMDTAGNNFYSRDRRGTTGMVVEMRDAQLASELASVVRSLGIVVHRDGAEVRFTTTEPVFDLKSKYERMPRVHRDTDGLLHIKSVEPIEPKPARCIQVDSPDATYLAGDFVPTHNSVTLNSIIAGALAAGAELAIADVPSKAVDYELWRPFVRPGGWGCESFEENAVMLQELYNEGNRRAEVLKRYGAKKLSELPADILATMPPVLIVCDEVTGLFAPANEKAPKGLASDHPLVIEAESKTTASALILSYIQKIAAEQRFVGFKLVLATQVASTATGIGTALRTNLGNKCLLGARATDGNRKLILADVSSAPEVPKHIQQAEGLIPKGVGVAELEAQRPAVFKSFYAAEKDFIRELNKRGIHGHDESKLDSITRPDPAKVKDAFPESFAAAQEAALEDKKYGVGPQQVQDWQVDPTTGERLDGRQAANRAKHLLTVQAKATAPSE